MSLCLFNGFVLRYLTSYTAIPTHPQWGTLNEAATQVAYDPDAERLVEAAGALFDTTTLQGGNGAGNLPPHLRRQLQAHLLRQQQLYGPFTKHGGGGSSGLLQV